MDTGQIQESIKKLNFTKGNGLIPVVVQDIVSGQILMQAFTNQEALKLSLESGNAHYWSRSRNRLWMKGEESQNVSRIRNVVADCDYDALLFQVKQTGPCCHTGQKTCFHNPILGQDAFADRLDTLQKLSATIDNRISKKPTGSYVAELVGSGENRILQKIGEEATELILAAKTGDRKHLISEAADLVFHVLIALRTKNIGMQEVLGELEIRHAKKTSLN